MANKSRTKQLLLRLNEEEYKRLQEKVSESGISQQEYILSCVLEKIKANGDKNWIKELAPSYLTESNSSGVAIKLDNMDEVTVAKLNALAKKRGMSRAAFLREKLTEISFHDDVTYVDNRYASLVETLAEQLKRMEETIDLNSVVLERVDTRLDEMEKILGDRSDT